MATAAVAAAAACADLKYKETSRDEMAALPLSYLTLNCYPLNAKEPGRA